MPLQFRRGTDAERQAMTTPLAPGEPLFVTTPGLEKLYIGDGVAMNGIPVTGYTDQNSLDAVGNSLVDNNGSNQQITFSYNTLTGVITASVSVDTLYDNLDLNSNDITGVGNIDIQGQIRGTFKGSLFGDDSTPLVDGVASSVLLNGTIKDDIVPANGFTVDIGSTTNRFNDVYLKENARIFLDDVILRVDTGFVDISGGMSLGDSLIIDGAEISSNGLAVNLPEGSTINGFPIESIAPGQNYNVNIVGNDSSIIVDVSTSTVSAIEGNFRDLTGNLIGDVKGSLFSDDSGYVVNGMTREVFAREISCLGLITTEELEINDKLIFENDISIGYINVGEVSPALKLGESETGTRVVYYGLPDGGPDQIQYNIAGANSYEFITSKGSLTSTDKLDPDAELINFRAFGRSNSGVTAARPGFGEAGRIILGTRNGYTITDGDEFIGGSIILAVFNSNDENDATLVIIENNTINTPSVISSGYVQFGSYDAAGRSALTAANGMVIYNTTANRFQGYQNGAWINLDDGTAAP